MSGKKEKSSLKHALCYAVMSVVFVFLLHKLPINHIFIDSFGEAIKYHDVTDIGLSKFRKFGDPALFDDRILLLNSEKTDRAEIAHACRYLLDAGVAAVGVDLLFDSLYHDYTDTLLATSLDDPRVVLGYTFNIHHSEGHSHDVDHDVPIDLASDPFFVGTSSQSYVNLGTDDGYSVRAFEPFHRVAGAYDQAFAVELASKLDPEVIPDLQARNFDKEWINFRRLQPGERNMVAPINSEGHIHYPYMSVERFLQDTASYSSSTLAGKIILIGFNGESDAAFSMIDRYFTPLNERHYGRSLPDMHGVVVHANIVSMLLDRDFLDELAYPKTYIACFLIFFLNYFIFSALHHKRVYRLLPVPTVRVVQLVQFVLLFSFCIYMIAIHSYKIGFILMIVSVIMSYEFWELYIHRIQHRVNRLLSSNPK